MSHCAHPSPHIWRGQLTDAAWAKRREHGFPSRQVRVLDVYPDSPTVMVLFDRCRRSRWLRRAWVEPVAQQAVTTEATCDHQARREVLERHIADLVHLLTEPTEEMVWSR